MTIESYYARNKDKIRARSKAWATANKERQRENWRKWNEKNKEKLKPRRNELQKERYHKNPEKAREQAKSYRNKLREEFIEEYGSICACCGEAEHVFLTLEHINRDGKAHRESARSGHTSTGILTDLKKRGWPKDNYELLCFNCNRASWLLGKCIHRIKGEANNMIIGCDI